MSSLCWIAFEEGRYTHVKGQGEDKNPYPKGSGKWKSWQRGWEHESKEMKRECANS